MYFVFVTGLLLLPVSHSRAERKSQLKAVWKKKQEQKKKILVENFLLLGYDAMSLANRIPTS